MRDVLFSVALLRYRADRSIKCLNVEAAMMTFQDGRCRRLSVNRFETLQKIGNLLHQVQRGYFRIRKLPRDSVASDAVELQPAIFRSLLSFQLYSVKTYTASQKMDEAASSSLTEPLDLVKLALGE